MGCSRALAYVRIYCPAPALDSGFTGPRLPLPFDVGRLDEIRKGDFLVLREGSVGGVILGAGGGDEAVPEFAAAPQAGDRFVAGTVAQGEQHLAELAVLAVQQVLFGELGREAESARVTVVDVGRVDELRRSRQRSALPSVLDLNAVPDRLRGLETGDGAEKNHDVG